MSVRNSVAQGSSAGGENMYSLKWNHYHSYLTNGLAKLLDDEFSMTDITLACEGQFIQAHKVALAVCSPFFKEYFKTYRMEKAGGLIVLANVRFRDLKNLMQFIYHGEVNVSNSDLNSFLKTANDLKIEGLVDAKRGENATNSAGLSMNEQMDRRAASTTTSIAESTGTTRLLSTGSSNNSSSGAPPVKRSRLSLSTTTGHSINSPSAAQTSSIPSASSSLPKSSEPSIPVVDTKQSTASSVQLPNVSHYDPLDMEDEQEEEMISFDEVKTEPIAVYTLNEDNDDDSLDHGGDSVSGTLHTDSSGMVYHDYESLSQPPGPGPSSSMQSHHRTQSGSAAKSTKTSVCRRSSNIGNTIGNKVRQWGRCHLCPRMRRTVSRSRCFGCSQFICAQPTCRAMAVVNNESVRMCRHCFDSNTNHASVSF